MRKIFVAIETTLAVCDQFSKCLPASGFKSKSIICNFHMKISDSLDTEFSPGTDCSVELPATVTEVDVVLTGPSGLTIQWGYLQTKSGELRFSDGPYVLTGSALTIITGAP